MPTINYQHRTHPRAKRLILRVEADGEVVVTTPKRTPKKIIAKFVNEHQDWITAEKNRQQQLPKPVTDTKVTIFGKEYQKNLEFSSEHPVGVRINEDTLILNPTDSKSAWGSKEDKMLNRYLKHTAERYIIPRTSQLSTRMEISYNRITLREQKTRWGSCSSKGNLNFNWRLVHYDTGIIDYVIIHELAHRQHMNHSKKFWQLVKKHDSEYCKHREFLKKQGMTLK